jgi:hypothetical protein
MSCACGNDPFCEGLPGAIPQNSDHGEALWNFFLGYDSFRKSTTPLPMFENRALGFGRCSLFRPISQKEFHRTWP